MRKSFRSFQGLVSGALVILGLASCAYDPYYSTSVATTYHSGFHGGLNSTSLFVGTGDPRWGYDPSCFSYFDYQRRCYYDPYLYGYYPVGFRPPVVFGTPHPYGWRPGAGICRPPGRVTNVIISDYRNRESAYRNSSFGWARQVGTRSPYGSRNQYEQNSYVPSRSGGRGTDAGSREGYRAPSYPSYRQPQTSFGSRWRSGENTAERVPSRYNSPVSQVEPRPVPARQTSESRVIPQVSQPTRAPRQESGPEVSRESRYGGSGRIQGFR